ncbi:hypothetical protein ACOTE3_23745 [Achromobacter xylosoxidans]
MGWLHFKQHAGKWQAQCILTGRPGISQTLATIGNPPLLALAVDYDAFGNGVAVFGVPEGTGTERKP